MIYDYILYQLMTNLYKYRLWCTVHSAWEFIWDESEPVSDANHTYAAGSITIVETQESNSVRILEESTQTGGYYQSVSKHMDITGGVDVVTTAHIFYMLPVSILNIEYVTTVDNKGDVLNAYVGKDTELFTSNIIGALTASIPTPTTWAAGSYVVGDVVTFTHPNGIFGTHEHTCILDTVSDEDPTNRTYWQEGCGISVSSTVLDYAVVGYEFVVTDGVTSDNVGEIMLIDSVNSKIYFDGSSANAYGPGAYIKMFRHIVKDVIIGNPSKVGLGRDTIGASYLPAYTIITVEYTNKSVDAKNLTMRISMLK